LLALHALFASLALHARNFMDQAMKIAAQTGWDKSAY
jgi:microsomal dipeptidase-like Zn-dependent dipeptidase